MAISTGLVLKTLGGLRTAAIAGVGSWWLLFGNDNSKLTKWDFSLISFLQKEGNDIVFEVKTGENADSELNDDFPSFEENKSKITITAKIKSTSSSLKGEVVDDVKNINKDEGEDSGKEWDWKCKIVFTKNSSDPNEIDKKDSLKKYFQELKKEISTVTDDNEKKNLRNLKQKLIKGCSNARKDTEYEKYKNKKKITSEKTFEMQSNNDANGSKLIPKIKEEFKDWFQIT